MSNQKSEVRSQTSEVKELPILFKGEMVLAILEGRKTQTRRICKATTQNQADIIAYAIQEDMLGNDDGTYEKAAWERIGCPYGIPGDRLWVKETFLSKASGTIYRADIDPFQAAGISGLYGGWKSSIFMSRRASRILLQIIGTRIERLTDISEEDAWAEGCLRGLPTDNGGFFPAEVPYPKGKCWVGWDCAKDWYADLWESINGHDSWDANPWVWVIEFKRVS